MCDFGNTAVAMNKDTTSKGITIPSSLNSAIAGATDFSYVYTGEDIRRIAGNTHTVFGAKMSSEGTSSGDGYISTDSDGRGLFATLYRNTSVVHTYFSMPEKGMSQLTRVISSSKGTDSLYINNILFAQSTFTGTVTATEIVDGIEYGAKNNSRHFFNYALTPAEVSLLWNSGRPDRAVLPDYMKWGSNVERVKNGTFDSGTNWIVRGGSSISDGVATVVGLGSISSTGNNWSICQIDIFIKTKSFRITLDVKYKSGTDTGALQVGVGYWIQRSIIPSA
jgi:hypothetical protein